MASSTPSVANQASMFRDNMADFAFFMDTERDGIMKKMAHLIDYTKLILFIQGSAGVGKTSLLKHRFVHNKKANWRVAVIDGSIVKNSKDLLAKLSLDFRFSDQANSQLPIELIVQQLDELRKSDQVAVLVIDNIEHLDKNLCNLLAELSIRHQGLPALLRLVMFGQQVPKPLDEAIKLAAQENRDEQINHIVLPKLSEDSTAEYIRHCLQFMGNSDIHLFDQATIHNIFEKSGGLIPRINDLANRVIGAPARASNSKNNNGVSALPLIAAALVITIVLSLFFFDQPAPPAISDEPQLADRGQRINSELPLPALGGDRSQRHSISIKDGEVTNSFDQLEPSDEAPTPAPELPPEPVVFEEPELPTFESRIKEVPALGSTDTAPPAEPEKTSEPASVVAEQPKPAPTPAPIKASTDNGLTLKKFKSAPASHYTLQLTAGANEAAIKRFIRDHQLGKQAIYVPGTRDGKPWFTVVYGLYDGRTAAVEASKSLPASLKNKPWIRTVSGLQ